MSVPHFTRLRTIIESHEATSAVDEARLKFQRFDDAWNGLNWLLARRPDSMGVAPSVGNGLRLYVQDGDNLAGAPRIWIMFKIQGETVEIMAVNFTQGDDDLDAD